MTAPAPAPRDAGVRLPPPLLYAVALLLGWMLERWRSLPITGGASAWRQLLAAVCLAAFLALAGGAIVTFRRARTTIIPNRPASRIATGGPYRMTRNPMYLGLVGLYLGIALLMNSWWALALLPIVVLAIDRAVIAREERYLTAAFPHEYPAYCARVRRWL